VIGSDDQSQDGYDTDEQPDPRGRRL
jgi:hypothetical protein